MIRRACYRLLYRLGYWIDRLLITQSLASDWHPADETPAAQAVADRVLAARALQSDFPCRASDAEIALAATVAAEMYLGTGLYTDDEECCA